MAAEFAVENQSDRAEVDIHGGQEVTRSPRRAASCSSTYNQLQSHNQHHLKGPQVTATRQASLRPSFSEETAGNLIPVATPLQYLLALIFIRGTKAHLKNLPAQQERPADHLT